MSNLKQRARSRKPMSPVEFFTRLYPSGMPISLASYANDRGEARTYKPRHKIITDPADVVAFIERNDVPGRACYFAVAPMQGQTRSKDQVASIVLLHVDVDFKGVVEDPATIKAAIGKLKLKPTAVVMSGNGLHCYWKLDKPLSRELTGSTEDILRRICKGLAGDFSVAEVARILRIPGSHNSKKGAWTDVEVIDELSSWKSYSIADLDAYFTELERAPLLTAVPDEPETGTNVIPFTLNCWQQYGRDTRSLTRNFDPFEALDAMKFHGTKKNGIDDTLTKVIGGMVRDEATVEDCIKVCLRPMRLVYVRDAKPGEGPFSERTAIRTIVAKHKHFTRKDKKKKPPTAETSVANSDGKETEMAPTTTTAKKSTKKKSTLADYDEPTERERPVFNVAGGALPKNSDDGERALIAAREAIYQRGGALVRPIISEVDAAHGRKTKVCELVPIEAAYLRDRLMKTADWQKYDARAKEWVAINCPMDVANTILARNGHWSFPALAGVISAPTMRPDGTLLIKAGYDKATRLLLVEPPELPEIPEKPTRKDAEAALAKLRSLLTEFPFVDPVAEAVALSGLITPIARGAFATAPMHIARASTPGSGKSYLWDTASAITSGFRMPVLSAGKTEEETEKRLGAALMGARPLISLDNVNGDLGGDALCQMIERPIVDIRILGKSELIRIESRGTTLYCTGNNVTIIGDLTRRVIVSSLDSGLERPELRKFKKLPVELVLADRGAYIAACLVIVRAYFVANRPNKAKPLASFEGWSDCVRSALMWLGVADPVESMEIVREEDPRLASHRDVLNAWFERFRDTPVRLSQVIDASNETNGIEQLRNPELHDAIDAVARWGGPPDAAKLAKWTKRVKNRIVDDLKLVVVESNSKGSSYWRVEKVKS